MQHPLTHPSAAVKPTTENLTGAQRPASRQRADVGELLARAAAKQQERRFTGAAMTDFGSFR